MKKNRVRYFAMNEPRWGWRIDNAEEFKQWHLKRWDSEMWVPCGIYVTAEQAAYAVGFGATGIKTWDKGTHKPEAFDLPRWTKVNWS